VKIRADPWLLQILSLQMESFPHQPLQPGFVEDVVGEFFIGEHGERGAFGSRDQLRRLFNCEVRVLADHGHHHADNDLQAADLYCFLLDFTALRVFQGALFPQSVRDAPFPAGIL